MVYMYVLCNSNTNGVHMVVNWQVQLAFQTAGTKHSGKGNKSTTIKETASGMSKPKYNSFERGIRVWDNCIYCEGNRELASVT